MEKTIVVRHELTSPRSQMRSIFCVAVIVSILRCLSSQCAIVTVSSTTVIIATASVNFILLLRLRALYEYNKKGGYNAPLSACIFLD